MSEWMPIETAPKDGTDVLLFTKEGIIQGYFTYFEWDQTVVYATYDGSGCVAFYREPTHWMPLPPPPKTEE